MKLAFRGVVCLVLVFVMLLNLLSLCRRAEQSCEDGYIVEEFYAFAEVINVAQFNIHRDDLSFLITKILKDDPYLFFVKNSMSYECDLYGKVLNIYPEYSMDSNEYADAAAFCRRYLEGILTFTDGVEDEYDRARILHDCLCINFSYDETLTSDNMYSFLRSGKGTCQGYSFTYIQLLREAGINATFAASDSMGHIWTLLEIGGEWYHADVTWDDKEQFNFTHDNFMCSDEEIKEARHENWYSPESVACEKNFLVGELKPYFEDFAHTGDVNCDGAVDVLDMILCGVRENGVDNTAFLLSASDVNRDYIYTNEDFECIRNIILD